MIVEIQKATGGQGLEFVGPSLKHGFFLEDGFAPIDGIVCIFKGGSHEGMLSEGAIDGDEVGSKAIQPSGESTGSGVERMTCFRYRKVPMAFGSPFGGYQPVG